ncbi:MAG: ArsI/CadI family heavy metal resistance metalloenzyme, partial [Acidimicrobiales bacterium]
LEEAIEFYATFFKTPPAKVRPGYANFAIDEPPLKLVLFEDAKAGGTINHLGVEVFSSEEVLSAIDYFATQGLGTAVEMHTTCCFAAQDKVWVTGPDDQRWEVYTVLEDVTGDNASTDRSCCATDPSAQAPVSIASSCC